MDNIINVSGVVEESIVDGPGIRLVVFTQGCNHNCLGCHNPDTHSFKEGKRFNIETIINKVKENPLLDGITLSGGEPFEQAANLSILACKIKELGYSVITYTGYTYEHILENPLKREGWNELLNNTDILVDGKFDIERKNLRLKFRGSENQRIIDIAETKTNREITLKYMEIK